MESRDQGQYSIGLDKTPANFVPLTPLSFLERSQPPVIFRNSSR